MTDVRAIDAAIRAAGTPERAVKEKAYLKSTLRHHGTTVPEVRRVVRDYLRVHKNLAGAEAVALAEALWAEPVHERRLAAVLLLESAALRLGAGDVAVIERLLREARTWALVDELAANVVGPMVERLPGMGRILDRWARDEDFWIRRSALLALLVALRRGGGDFERFGRYADAMLEEKEFFIRKAIGWVLRETSKKRPELVADWLAPREARLSGVTRREAFKYLGSGSPSKAKR